LGRAVAKGPKYPAEFKQRLALAGALNRLTRDERALYEALRDDMHGERIRMEQERIGFGAVLAALQPYSAVALQLYSSTALLP